MGESVLVCAACGASSIGGIACSKCGGALVSAPQTPPDAIIPRTVVPQSQGGLNLPSAGRMNQAFGAPAAPKPARPARKGPSTIERAQDAAWMGLSRLNYIVKSTLAILFLLALAFGGLLLFSQHRAVRAPKFVVKALAENYLEMARVGDYANAYAMLTAAAKSAVPLDEFRQARDARLWTWSNARIVVLEPEAALVAYELTIPGEDARADHLFFTLENAQWLRPYNASLLQKAEAALRANDSDMAALLAQEATRVNPRDPVSRSYLCEAYYFRRRLDDAERECRHALALTSRYPSVLRPRSALHVSATLADALRGLGKHSEAAAIYDGLLSDAALTIAERCDALKARAASRQALGQTAAANADLEAARPCPDQ